jgi:hypothetical protein
MSGADPLCHSNQVGEYRTPLKTPAVRLASEKYKILSQVLSPRVFFPPNLKPQI